MLRDRPLPHTKALPHKYKLLRLEWAWSRGFCKLRFMPNARRLGFNRELGVFAALSSSLFSAIDGAKGDNFLFSLTVI